MNDTLMRQWAMLRAIPRHPRRVDTPTIHARLRDQGMVVSLRTVQRDLNTLATTFPLDFDESKPQGWCWREGAGQFEIPEHGCACGADLLPGRAVHAEPAPEIDLEPHGPVV